MRRAVAVLSLATLLGCGREAKSGTPGGAISLAGRSGRAAVPCTRHDMHLLMQVGASAHGFGQEIGSKVGSEIFKRHVTRIDPPGARLCEAVGAGGEG